MTSIDYRRRLMFMKSSKSETLFYVPTVSQIRTFQFNTNDAILTPFHQHQWAYFLCNFDLFCSWRGQINFIYYKFPFFFLSENLLSLNVIPVLFCHCLFHQPAQGFGDCSGSHRISPCTPRQEASSFCSVTQSTLECTASLKDKSLVILKLHYCKWHLQIIK